MRYQPLTLICRNLGLMSPLVLPCIQSAPTLLSTSISYAFRIPCPATLTLDCLPGASALPPCNPSVTSPPLMDSRTRLRAHVRKRHRITDTPTRHTSASSDPSLHVPQALTPRIPPAQGLGASLRRSPRGTLAADGSQGPPVRCSFEPGG